MADRIRVQKREYASKGGDLADETDFIDEINPNDDGVDCRSVFLQNDTSEDSTVELSRDASDNMTFADGVVAGVKTLSDLLATGSGGEVNLGANVGDGADVFRDKVGVTLNFRGIKAVNTQNLLTSSVNSDNVELNVLHDSAYWNALKLLGKQIDDTGLGDDYLLRYDVSSSQWKVEALGAAPTVANVMQLMANVHDFVLSTSYQVVGEAFIFGGSNTWGTPTEILALHSQTGAATKSHDLRVYDVTNGNVICEITGFNNLVDQVDNLGIISNVPTTSAIWEVQARRVGGGNKLHLGTFSIRGS